MSQSFSSSTALVGKNSPSHLEGLSMGSEVVHSAFLTGDTAVRMVCLEGALLTANNVAIDGNNGANKLLITAGSVQNVRPILLIIEQYINLEGPSLFAAQKVERKFPN